MTESYLSRHRPICTVIDEIRERMKRIESNPIIAEDVIKLCDEATDYAQRMSARLMEYKRKEEGHE